MAAHGHLGERGEAVKTSAAAAFPSETVAVKDVRTCVAGHMPRAACAGGSASVSGRRLPASDGGARASAAGRRRLAAYAVACASVAGRRLPVSYGGARASAAGRTAVSEGGLTLATVQMGPTEALRTVRVVHPPRWQNQAVEQTGVCTMYLLRTVAAGRLVSAGGPRGQQQKEVAPREKLADGIDVSSVWRVAAGRNRTEIEEVHNLGPLLVEEAASCQLGLAQGEALTPVCKARLACHQDSPLDSRHRFVGPFEVLAG